MRAASSSFRRGGRASGGPLSHHRDLEENAVASFHSFPATFLAHPQDTGLRQDTNTSARRGGCLSSLDIIVASKLALTEGAPWSISQSSLGDIPPSSSPTSSTRIRTHCRFSTNLLLGQTLRGYRSIQQTEVFSSKSTTGTSPQALRIDTMATAL